MSSQLLGVLAATASGGDAKEMQTGAWVAANSTQYNYLFHEEVERMLSEVDQCPDTACKNGVREGYAELDEARNKGVASLCEANPQECQVILDRLVAEQPVLLAKVEDLRKQGQSTPALIVGYLIGSSNTEAMQQMASSLSDESPLVVALGQAMLSTVTGGQQRPTGGGTKSSIVESGSGSGGAKEVAAISGGPKVPPKLQPLSNPPQGPVIPSGWVSRPGKTPGSTIYYPPGSDPSAPGSTYIRLMPSGSTPVPGLENGYWISVKNGQPINPATGGTGTRGDTHVPLPPDTVPPKR
ncbi:hypothetical protein ACX3YG_08840 [Pseudomonas wadenswilerensis]